MEPTFEKDLEAAIDFRATLLPESDRGCALMAAAYLDNRLADLLVGFLVDDPNLVRDFLKPDRALGTFSSLIDLAYLVGLISKNERKALHLIRKIRNDFGHVPEPITFDEQSIAARCRNLEEFNYYKRATHRGMFTGAVMMVLAGLNTRLRAARHREVQPNAFLPDASDPSVALYVAFLKFVGSKDPGGDAITELEHAIGHLIDAGEQDELRLAHQLTKRIVERISEVDK